MLKNNIQNNDSLVENKSFAEKTNSTSEIIPYDFTYQTPILTQSTGPIISYGSTITSLDWFGAKRWQINLLDNQYAKYFPSGKNRGVHFVHYTNRAFINWSLDQKNNILWLLTNSYSTTGQETNKGYDVKQVLPQCIIGIDTITGNIIHENIIQLDRQLAVNKGEGSRVNDSQYRLFYQISALASGKVLVYAQGNQFWGLNYLYDPKTKTMEFNNVDEPTKDDRYTNNIKLKEMFEKEKKDVIRMLYLVPVSKNRNIGVFVDRKEYREATGDLLLTLLDDNLVRVETGSNSQWSNLYRIKNPFPHTDNGWNTGKVNDFSKSYYSTLDGRVYFTAYNSFFIFYPPKNGKDVTFDEYKFENNRILSFTMDVNENVYFKFVDDTKVQKLIIDGKEQGKTNFSISTYYDISSSNNQDISESANKFVIFNVNGYSGSMMLIKADIVDSSTIKEPTLNDNKKDKYGLAVGIVPNKSDQSTGDSVGLLNGPDSILKSSDFRIEETVLNNKLPSEITREDITVLNDGFFTSNKELNENGELKYPPFKLENIDDLAGTVDVVVNLDQIPWFATRLPNNSIPKTITKKITTAKKIENKISWKSQNQLSYDFKNTLPSKIRIEDINNFDPFQVSFNSRIVVNSNGEIEYPKKTYSISTYDDNKGTISIGIKYDYMPLSSEVTTPKTYSSNQTYNIFKKNETRQFYFAGSNGAANSSNSSEIDIKSVPQLKQLSESNFLPSSFDGVSKEKLLAFIDTNKSKGYPISRMNFSSIPDDENGKLTVIATMPASYSGTQETFRQTYIGLNKKTNYSFSFVNSLTQINGQNISLFLPSSVNKGDVINDFITYRSFNSSDLSVSLKPNNDNGTLTVTIKLSDDYPESIAIKNGFSNYQITKTFSGFMSTKEFNNQYNIDFYDDSSPELIEIKKLTLNDINQKINIEKSLIIKGQTYNDLTSLVRGVFIKSVGIKIPNDWSKNKDKITSTMSFNNQAGTMNLSITIDSTLLPGYGTDLNVVKSYSGFAKGNINPTNDSLSFISQELLKNDPEIARIKTAKEFEIFITSSKNNLSKIIMSVTGQYVELIKENKYKISTQINEVYNSITITLTFEDVTDPTSLTEYSIQYRI